MKKQNPSPPKVFISYSWDSEEHKSWVRSFTNDLLNNGVDAILDQYDIHLGDRLPEFMEKSISDADYVLIICTPIYKQKADNRAGGVGYEGHIISGELYNKHNERKFIPILRTGTFDSAFPRYLSGKTGVDLSNEPSNAYYKEEFNTLIKTLFGEKGREKPPIGKRPDFKNSNHGTIAERLNKQVDTFCGKKNTNVVLKDAAFISPLENQNIEQRGQEISEKKGESLVSEQEEHQNDHKAVDTDVPNKRLLLVTSVLLVMILMYTIFVVISFGTGKVKLSGINQSRSSFSDGSDINSIENNNKPMFGIIGYQATKNFTAGWFDSDGGRPGYTIDEVNAGALGDTVTLNSIIDGSIGHEFNFVAAVDGTFLRSNHMWLSDTIDAIDGYAYQVRLYFENSSWSTSAEDVAIRFDICDTVWIAKDDDNSPEETTERNGYYLSAVHGYIIGSNSVCFGSERPFHLEYKDGTAVLENQGIGSGIGYSLSDDIVHDWITIGYDKIDGVIPAGYQYDGQCIITVVPVFDQEPVSKFDTLLVRKEGVGDWRKSIEVNKGDIVEFQYHFINYETLMWDNIHLYSVLPDDITYIKGSTLVFDAENPDGTNVETDDIVSESGFGISNQKPIKEAYVRFQAVVGDISDKSDVYVESRIPGEYISDSVVLIPST